MNQNASAAVAPMEQRAVQRRLPIGAEIVPGRGVHFRVWAPLRSRVEVIFEDGLASCTLPAEGDGYFSGFAANAAAGSLYRFRLDEGDTLYPDPASRFQPDGPHGASRIVDPNEFNWTDDRWIGVQPLKHVVYELHIGTFTREGTFRAATAELEALASLGITVVEVMPVAEFPGAFGWGYDGVDIYAPTRLYGEPDDFRRFVDRAHALGIGVILDVVYNHLGPDGCYLREFSKDYFSDRYENEWGDPLNFDGANAGPVREFFVANAQYWIQEFHLDGLRLDATQQMFDASPTHVIAEVTQRVRAASGKRLTYVVCENEAQDVIIVRAPEAGGYGADALWNDDFHHAAHVALTGQSEAYYTDYAGAPQELVSAAKYGTLYHGQYYSWQKKRRGTPTFHTPPRAFVNYLENHDQIANSARGERIHRLAGPAHVRAMTALLLLGPQTPMLFQGQEFAASAPFLFFADHKEKLAADVRKGRAEFLCQFASIATPEVKALLADPGARETFERSKLDLSERTKHHEAYALHRDLLQVRRDDPVFWGEARRSVDGAVLGPNAFVLRFFAEDGDDRLLLVNLGATLDLHISPEPLLAPPQGRRWAVHWSSESPAYGGSGVTQPETADGWRVPGESAIVLIPNAA